MDWKFEFFEKCTIEFRCLQLALRLSVQRFQIPLKGLSLICENVGNIYYRNGLTWTKYYQDTLSPLIHL